jgi:hypothetical protein
MVRTITVITEIFISVIASAAAAITTISAIYTAASTTSAGTYTAAALFILPQLDYF